MATSGRQSHAGIDGGLCEATTNTTRTRGGAAYDNNGYATSFSSITTATRLPNLSPRALSLPVNAAVQQRRATSAADRTTQCGYDSSTVWLIETMGKAVTQYVYDAVGNRLQTIRHGTRPARSLSDEQLTMMR